MVDSQSGAERWWPQLSIEGKHAVLRDLDDGTLDEPARSEIAEITGHEPPERLSDADARFIRTQIEAVD